MPQHTGSTRAPTSALRPGWRAGVPRPHSRSFRWKLACWFLLAAISGAAASAGNLDAVSSKEASGGLRAALSQGVDKAIALLGSPDGFLKNPQFTIPLPPALEKADQALRFVGLSGQADELRTAMNHAAELAVADAKPVFKQAVQRMTVADAKSI